MYLFLDNEAGGIGREYSLLTVYLQCVDDNFNFVDDLYLYLKPDNGIYKVCGEAMSINKIDLKTHDKVAITYKEGGTKLYNWLKKIIDNNKTITDKTTKINRLTVVGHGIHSDVESIIHNLISRGSWENFVSYRKLDTSTVCEFLKSCDMFLDNVNGSLISLAKHFGIDVDENQAHDAKYDTQLTFKVFMALRNTLLNIHNECCHESQVDGG